MTRQLITALIIAVTSTAAINSVQADCGGLGCRTAFGFHGFHARFGCSPREAYVLFQKHPELITRFPQMARVLQAEFGTIATTATATVATTDAVVATDGTPAVDPAVAATPAAAAVTTDVATDAAPAAAVPATDVPATDAPIADAPAEGAAVTAPVSADAVADPSAPPVDLPAIQPELEPLLGLWVNESDAADQAIAKINLENDGNAVVTINTAVGQAEVKKPFAIEDDTFKLDGNDLATVVSADADKVVLDANGTSLTFVRP